MKNKALNGGIMVTISIAFSILMLSSGSITGVVANGDVTGVVANGDVTGVVANGDVTGVVA